LLLSHSGNSSSSTFWNRSRQFDSRGKPQEAANKYVQESGKDG